MCQEDVEEYGEGGDAAAHEKNSWAQVTPREQLQTLGRPIRRAPPDADSARPCAECDETLSA